MYCKWCDRYDCPCPQDCIYFAKRKFGAVQAPRTFLGRPIGRPYGHSSYLVVTVPGGPEFLVGPPPGVPFRKGPGF